MTTTCAVLAAASINDIIFWALAVIGGLAISGFLIALAYFGFDEWRLGREVNKQVAFDPSQVDRGTQILDYANEEVLRTIAGRHNLEVPPSMVEHRRDHSVKGGPRGFQGSMSDGTTEMLEPHDNLGELVRRILRHLDKEGQLDQSADCVLADLLDDGVPPFLLDHDSAREFFKDWLVESYPEGLAEVPPEILAEALAGIGRNIPESKIRQHLTDTFEGLQQGSDHLLFLEGEWAITEDGDKLTLSRTDLRVAFGNGEIGTGSLPMPTGILITAQLDSDALRPHGRNRMVGVRKPIRACILATEREYGDGHYQLTPIAVFQRLV